MGFRCSILGCEYEGTEHERERDQRGEEVVFTVREYEECRRCGDRQLVSENTGVTTTPTVEADGGHGEWDPDDATGQTVDGGDAGGFDDSDAGEFEAGDDDAVLLGEDAGSAEEIDVEDAGTDPVETTEETPPADIEDLPDEEGVESIDVSDVSEEEPLSAAATVVADVEVPESAGSSDTEDDAAFVGEGATEAGAGEDAAADVSTDESVGGVESRADSKGEAPTYDHGTWPDPTDGEDANGDGDGTVSATSGDDATGGASERMSPASETDGATTAVGPAAGTVTATDATAGVEESGHDATVEHGPGAQTTRTDVDGRLRCRSCGFGVSPTGTPHRAGDLCPDCGRDYLDEG